MVCLLLIGYVSAAFALAHIENDARTCTGIDLRIEGSAIPDSVMLKGINSQLRKYGHRLKGERIGNINLQELEDYLGDFTNFESVECSFNPDSRLRITVTPIKPEVRVFASDGSSYYINRYGKHIDADAEFFMDVPVLLSSKRGDSHIDAALPVIRYVSADPELQSLVAAYKVDGPHDIILIPRIQGHLVNFGDSTRLDEKRSALLAAYRQVMPVKGWNFYDTISVKFKNQIVASRRNKAVSDHGPEDDDGEDLEEATLPDVVAEATANAPQPTQNVQPTTHNESRTTHNE